MLHVQWLCLGGSGAGRSSLDIFAGWGFGRDLYSSTLASQLDFFLFLLSSPQKPLPKNLSHGALKQGVKPEP